MKGIYLGACRAYHPNYNIDYNDIFKASEHINIICDMLEIDLTNYDYIIATPPCNWWSRANRRRDESYYALTTKHLLPDILLKCIRSNKPFIVENVRNYNRFLQNGIIDICEKNGIFIYEYGRHTYFTNILLNMYNIPQIKDNIKYTSNSKTTYRQGGLNVHVIVEYFLEMLGA